MRYIEKKGENKMAWESAVWACGHKGAIQLFGKQSGRDSRIAYEASRMCMVCWLLEQWESKKDPRSKREDKFDLASAIAENKGIRIRG
jgi:hypothetical protein